MMSDQQACSIRDNFLIKLNNCRNEINSKFKQISENVVIRQNQLLAELDGIENKYSESQNTDNVLKQTEKYRNEQNKGLQVSFLPENITSSIKHTIESLDVEIYNLRQKLVAFTNIDIELDTANITTLIDKLGSVILTEDNNLSEEEKATNLTVENQRLGSELISKPIPTSAAKHSLLIACYNSDVNNVTAITNDTYKMSNDKLVLENCELKNQIKKLQKSTEDEWIKDRHHNENLIKEVAELKSQLDKYSESYSDLFSKHQTILAYSTQLENRIKQLQMKINSTSPESAAVHNNTEHRIINQPTANTGANYAPMNSGNYVPKLRPDSYIYTVALFLQNTKQAISAYNVSHLVDPNLHIGQMVLCKFKKSNKYYVYGILRCIFANRREMNILMAGIDLFDQVGNSNGIYDGIQYFRVDDKHAIFLPLEEVVAPKQN